MHQKFTLAKTVAFLFFVACLWQNTNAQKQPATKDITSLLDINAPAIGLSSFDRENTRVQNAYYSSQSGITLVYLQQTYKGIDVHTALKVLAFKGDKLVSVAGSLEPKMQRRANNAEGTPGMTPQGAVTSAAKLLNLPVVTQFAPLKFNVKGAETIFGNLGIAADSIRTKLLWVPAENSKKMILCWQVQIHPNKSPDHWLVRVDASTGELVDKANITIKCNWTVPHNHTADCYEDREYGNNNSAPEDYKDADAINSAKYRVVPFPVEAPTFPGGTPALVTNPWLLSPAGSPATTLKWNDDGTAYAITRGNNVYAQEDHDANDNTLGQAGKSKTGVPDLEFDYLPNLAGEPSDSLNEGFALTNLFYWNNIMHDITYQYGFDEVAGNFQQNNLGRGGEGGDMVIADGQDAEALNNANFGTPPDGQSPRMQMFLFNTTGDGDGCLINAPAAIKGYKQSVEGDVSTQNRLSNVGPVTANLALYNDASGNNTACAVATNAAELAGKIALIYRSGCDFTVKIKNAQNAGAIGVIMVNNIAGDPPFSMGANSPDNTITIPALMIGKTDGDAIKALLTGGTVVNATLKATQMLDGSLDAGVMNHEFTHGVSNRLVGGPSNTACLELTLKEQMGEGWSDYFALMTTTDWTKAQLTDGGKARPIGTYVLDESPTGGGIRNYPYSTNMAINPWTYGKMKSYPNIEEHTVGEVWCVALWDMTWNIIQQDGVINTNFFNANNAGGNTVAMKLVTEAMKLTKCSPGFVDARDAVLKADTILYNAKYSCAIWKAFARRGLGTKASQGSSKSITDQVEDFTTPTFVTLTKHTGVDSVAQNGELSYTITATCTCADRTGLKITDTLPANVTYVSGDGSYNSAKRTVTFSGISLGASKSVSYKIKVKVNGGTYFNPKTLLSDAVTQATIPAATWQTATNVGTAWFTSGASFKSASLSYFAKDSTVPSVKTLVTTNAYPVAGLTMLSFWHSYNLESLYDGGVVEGSTDNGATWVDLGKYIVANGYNNSIDTGNGTVLAGKRAFTGSSATFINTKVNLSAFGGKNIKIRFKLVTDDGTGSTTGWYIDDISLTSTAAVYNVALLYNSTDSLENTGDTLTYIKKGPLPVTWGGFEAEKVKTTARLTWKTMLELNTDKFEVERSADGVSYAAIGSVEAAGNSNSVLSYQYNDVTPLQGINYYRIKQLDKNGQSSYSPTRYLTFGDANGVSITPNPAKDKITVTVPGNIKPLKVYLVTNTGQRLTSYDMQGASLNIVLPPLASGVYYVRIEGPGTSSQHKLVIK